VHSLDVFDLVAKIRLDSSEYESGVGKAQGTFSNLAAGIGKGVATVAKVGAAAVAAGTAGVVALTKMGIEGYAQYEQLTGGVETLFKGSSDAVMKYAENAYKTSGMSANQYMETVTSFSASLIQSLDGDTAKAAEVADMAITDMSDNANKMGTSIEMIQNAYNGFAKGNFTMLDNLKLGYGGTQEEMKRLLKDAEAISGVKYDISSYADIVEAIHVIQEEMGVAGTTAREAASTIEGSLAMMKGAWENLVVGMADSNADMDTLINNFVESTAIAAQNILPRIEQTLIGIGSLVEKLAPVIAEALPKLIESVLPSLLAAGINLVSGLVSGIIAAAPGIYNALMEAIFIALTTVFGMSEESANTFIGTIDGIIQSLVAFFQAGFDAIANLFNWLVTQAQTEGTFFNMVWENIKTFVSAAVSVIQSHITAFTAILRGDWSAAWSAVQSIAQTVSNAVTNIVNSMVSWITGFLGTMVEKGTELINSLQEGIQNKFAELFTLVGGWVTDNIVNPIANKATDIFNKGKAIVDKLKEGMKSAWESLKSWFEGVWDSLFNRKTTVTSDGNGNVTMKPHATGLNYVPYDEYPALLHRGEAVLTAAEARVWRNGGYSATPAFAGVTINQYIQSVPQTPVEFANTTEAYFEQARWML
jgi:hypothetical protein